jgi:hypothetical protein
MPSEFLLNARQLRSTVIVVQLITANSTVMRGGTGESEAGKKNGSEFLLSHSS